MLPRTERAARRSGVHPSTARSEGSANGKMGPGAPLRCGRGSRDSAPRRPRDPGRRSEEHTSELQSLMRSSYAVFSLKKKKIYKQDRPITTVDNTATQLYS